jgi:hypothetical protein
MSQADSQIPSPAEPQADSQVDSQQAVPQPQPLEQTEDFVRVPVHSIPADYGKDIYGVIHDANEYRTLKKAGWTEAASRAGEFGEGIDGYWFINQLGQMQASPEPTDQQPYQSEQPDVAAIVDERLEQFGQQWEQRETMRAAQQRETAAYDEALQEMGFTRNPQDVDFGGTTIKTDVIYDGLLKVAIANRVQRLLERRVGEHDPNRQAKINAPAPPELVREAAKQLQPYLTTFKQQAAEKYAAEQATIPSATLSSEGPSARPQKSPEEMTLEERKAEVMRRAKANPDWKGEEARTR